MKKVMFIATILISSFSLSVGAANAGYLVSGAGAEDANGLYCENGEICGLEVAYMKEGTNWVIANNSIFGLQNWAIGTINCGEMITALTRYYMGNVISSPPALSGWTSTLPAYVPAPTLSSQACEPETPEPKAQAVPTVTQWGMFILASLLILSAAYFIRKRRG